MLFLAFLNQSEYVTTVGVAQDMTKQETRSPLKWIRLIALNFLIFVIMMEFVSQAYYRIKYGHTIFSFHSKLPHIGEAYIGRTQSEVDTRKVDIELHPYFGYVGANHIRYNMGKYCKFKTCVWSVNNSGFFSLYDYPLAKKNEKQYVIGIFGGSVSVALFLYAQDHLVERLKSLDYFKDREIIVLSFGFGAYKQPQQLQVLSYFLSVVQVYDLVINVDGFNEVALGYGNIKWGGIDVTMPFWAFVKPALQLLEGTAGSSEKLDGIIRLRRERMHANVLADQINAIPLASIRLFQEYRYNVAVRKYQAAVQNYKKEFSKGTLSGLYHLDVAPADAKAKIYERAAVQWAESSIMMNDILKSRGIPYLHFLQPNQHYTKRRISEEETHGGIVSESDYRTSVEQGYPILLKYTDRLLESGVNFYSAVDAFEGETRPIYQDSCCHYTKLGNEILIDFIFDRIMESGILKEYESA